MSWIATSAVEIVQAIRTRRVSAAEVAAAFLQQIQAHDAAVQAYLRVDPDRVLADARSVDDKIASGRQLGKLAGLPVAIKDVLCTRGEVTTCGSRMLQDFVPPYDAHVIERLRQEDAILLGKTNMDEFAMGGSTENSGFYPTRNPWNLSCIPGGSSGGSAACVAARMAPISLGTDTGGSIRQPAGLCGVVGLKPTYGRVSRYGLVAFASSLDQIGPMAHSAEDAALLLSVIAGHDPRDSTSADRPVPDYEARLAAPLKGLRLGLVREHFGAGLDAEIEAAVREAVRVLESLGAKTKEISLPHNKYGIATYYVIAPCEASSNLARYDGVHYGHRTNEQAMLAELAAERAAAADPESVESPLVRMYRQSRSEGFGPEVQRRIMLGTFALSKGYYDAYYLKALKVRRLIRRDYDAAFGEVDLIVGPVSPTPAFPLGAKLNDPLAMYLEDLYTVATNLAGLPGISIPCGFTRSGLPIGLQMQAPAFEEDRLLGTAHQYQQTTDWHHRQPAL